MRPAIRPPWRSQLLLCTKCRPVSAAAQVQRNRSGWTEPGDAPSVAGETAPAGRAARLECGLRPVGDLQLVEDAADVVLHRLHRQAQIPRDLGIALRLGDAG